MDLVLNKEVRTYFQMHEFTTDRGNKGRFELLLTRLSQELYQVFILEDRCMSNYYHVALQHY